MDLQRSVIHTIARVELPGDPPDSEYEELHKEMEESKFYRTCIGRNGLKYKLPKGTYYSNAWDLSEAASTRIKRIADGIRPGSQVVVLSSISPPSLEGLEEAKT